MIKKRTDMDFSKHILTTEKRQELLVHTLAKPDTYIQSFVFINTNGIMAVTGDYGNWIFCREFHPSKGACVSDAYWVEKLKIGSCQDPYVFDCDEAQRQCLELLNIPADLTKEAEKVRLKELKIISIEDLSKAIKNPTSYSEEDFELLSEIWADCTQYSEEELEWLQDLHDAADGGEYTFIAEAMNRPSSFDTECIPRGKILNYHLNFVFDAFEEICSRL